MGCACAMLSSVACSVVQNLFHVFHKRHDFLKKKVAEHKSASRFSLQLLSETFLILRRVERDIKSVYWSSCKVPIIQNFLDIFSKNSQISEFLKIRSVGAEMFHAVRQKDRLT